MKKGETSGNHYENLDSDAETMLKNEEVPDEENEIFDTTDFKYLKMREKFSYEIPIQRVLGPPWKKT
jgi:hypothetical protein